MRVFNTFETDAAHAIAPDRNDALIAHQIVVPAMNPPNPPRILGLNDIPIPAVPAANPAAIAPNRIVVMSGLSHSSQKKRRTLEQLGGGGGGGQAVQPRNPEQIFHSFTEMQRIQNLSAVNANLLSILTGSRDMPDSDDRTNLLSICLQGLRANAAAMSTPQNPQPLSHDGLTCPICQESCTFVPDRHCYLNTFFTKCGHAFHCDCLNSWKTSGAATAAQCPDCRALL